MRRCYWNVALALSGILIAGNTFSNSCSLTTFTVYAAENTLSGEVILPVQSSIDIGEENVETELPAEKSVQYKYQLEAAEYDILLKIVEAEAGCEDLTGKMLVANVVMNRVNSDQFPDTVSEVVYQKYRGTAQFSPTVDGSIDRVTVSEETINAVEQVLQGEDQSMGALYFRSVHCSGKWHDNHLTRIIEHGNHIFYTI